MSRILVVDDQKISRLTLAGILGDADHQVRAEGSGREGLNTAREWLPDVIILDVHMPEMDGFEVVAHLKEDPATRSIPVVFLTGDPPTDELIVRGLDLGAVDFLSKGCSKAELLARVSAMARIKRSHDELAAIARISDALLQAVEPVELGLQFVREARKVFRANSVVMALARHGRNRLVVADGREAEDTATVEMLRRVGNHLHAGEPARAEILTAEESRSLVGAPLDEDVACAAAACVRRGPTAALVVVTLEEAEALDPEVDLPLLRNLSSQATMAIEHALLNERARRQARDLERAITERSRFFASLSHELRTPINAVIGYNHLLQEKIFGELTESQSEALEKANRSAQHLLELVDDILDISKIEAGKLEVFPERVDVAALLRDTATSVQLQAREKGIDLEIDTPESFRIETDPARVRQIVLNLLSNAVKFTDEGLVELNLTDGGNGEVDIRVRDTGPGISEEDRERIFEEFEQAGYGSMKGGTGLGLAISRRLAALLGGGLDVESKPGAGSTFILRLPTTWQPEQQERDPVD